VGRYQQLALFTIQFACILHAAYINFDVCTEHSNNFNINALREKCASRVQFVNNSILLEKVKTCKQKLKVGMAASKLHLKLCLYISNITSKDQNHVISAKRQIRRNISLTQGKLMAMI
jgi:hypothetical protein